MDHHEAPSPHPLTPQEVQQAYEALQEQEGLSYNGFLTPELSPAMEERIQESPLLRRYGAEVLRERGVAEVPGLEVAAFVSKDTALTLMGDMVHEAYGDLSEGQDPQEEEPRALEAAERRYQELLQEGEVLLRAHLAGEGDDGFFLEGQDSRGNLLLLGFYPADATDAPPEVTPLSLFLPPAS